MANVVEVVITVDNAQAIRGVQQFSGHLTQLSASANASSAAFSTFGASNTRVETSFRRLNDALDQNKGHIATQLDIIRLLSQEFGLRLPRALESMLSRMPAVTSAISGMVGAFAGIAVAEVLYRAGDAAYNMYEKYISLTAAAEDYNKEVQKHKDEDFINPHSIETATDRIAQATKAARDFQAVGEEIHSGAWQDILSLDPNRMGQGITGLYAARQVIDERFKFQAKSDAMDPKALSMQHELTMMQIEAAHASDSELKGQAKINAELQKKLELNRENQNYTRAQDSILQGIGNVHGGEQKRKLEDQQARAEAAAQEIALNREVTTREIALRNEATNAALQGESLYAAQKKQAEDAITRELVQGDLTVRQARALTAATDSKFENERLTRIQHLEEETRKLVETQKRAGLSGVPAISADLTSQLDDIEQRRKLMLSSEMSDPDKSRVNEAFDQQRISANNEAMRKRQKLDAEYTSYVDGQVSERLRNEMSAMQKVSEAQAQQHREAQKRYDEQYVKTDILGNRTDLGSDKNRADLARENGAIDQAAAADRLRINQELHERTLQMERQSAEAEKRVRSQGLFGWADQYKQTVAEIEAQHSAMIGKIAEDEKKNGGDLGEYARQKVAADAEANAEIEEANQQLAHSISGMLETAFDGSMKSLEAKFKKMAFDLIGGFLAEIGGGGPQFGGGAHPSSATTGGAGGAAGGSAAGGFLSGALSSVMPSMSRGGSYSSSPIGAMMHHFGFGGGSSTSAPAAASPGSRPYGGSSGTAAPGVSIPGAISASTAVGAGLGAGFGWGGGQQLGVTPQMANAATDEAQAGTPSGPAGTGSGMAQAAAGASSAGSGASGLTGAAGNAAQVQTLVGSALGAYTGAKGMVGAFEAGNAGGVLSGATSGLELGASVGMLFGPAGAAIGGAAGALAGAAVGILGDVTGEGGRLSGAKYYKSTILPAMEAAEQAYVRGSGGSSQDAVGQIDQIARQGYTAIVQKYGGSAADWVQSQYISKQQKFLDSEIQQMASGGRDYMTRAAVQFHTGGTITGFGDLSTSANEGFIHAMIGEKVANTSASSTHGSYIDAMNSGASERDVAAMYLRNTAAGSGAGGSTTIHQHGDVHVSAIDAGGFESYLRRGGMDSIAKVENERAALYSGDSY